MLTPHPAWRALDAHPIQRSIIWREILDEALTDQQLDEIRRYVQPQRLWGRDDFPAMGEAKPKNTSRALAKRIDREIWTREPDPVIRAPLTRSCPVHIAWTGVPRIDVDPTLKFPAMASIGLLSYREAGARQQR